jgi:death-on-curing protein
VLALHKEQLAEHGGADGLRDEALLDSALDNPQNVFAYTENADIFRPAASYAFGIARNHPFVDGNKRAALVSSMTFLRLNGWEIDAPRSEEYETFYGLAARTVSEQELAEWFSAHSVAV